MINLTNSDLIFQIFLVIFYFILTICFLIVYFLLKLG